jgi:hypothetical protein
LVSAATPGFSPGASLDRATDSSTGATADLIAQQRLDREPLAGECLYVGHDGVRAAAQIARRAEMGRALTPAVTARALASAAVIAVLVEIIHGTVVRLDAPDVAARLVARGVAVTSAQVEEVFRRYGLVKNTPPSRRSPPLWPNAAPSEARPKTSARPSTSSVPTSSGTAPASSALRSSSRPARVDASAWSTGPTTASRASSTT